MGNNKSVIVSAPLRDVAKNTGPVLECDLIDICEPLTFFQ